MMSRVKSWLGLTVLAALLGLVCVPANAGKLADANAGKGGETLDLKALVVEGKTTLIDFYSPFCPPCVQLAPILDQLAAKRPDLSIRKVNVNRPGVNNIDWRSPLAQQYEIRRLPYFMIFSPQGKLLAQGDAAIEQLKDWLQKAELMR
jgi:thiol-disulfide isomerase/thioredoxin